MSAVVDGLDELSVASLVDRLRRLGTSPAWLFAVADPVAVEAALRRGIPQFASGEVILRECRVNQVRVRRDSVTAVYRLTIEGADAQPQFLELRGEIFPPGDAEPEVGSPGGPIGTDGWNCYLPELRLALRTKPTDAALPVLPVLIEPESARALLERGIRSGPSAYADFRFHACTPEVARYKPGRRCTVVYQLEFLPEDEGRGWPNPVVAKTHDGAKGRTAYEGMLALWNSRLRTAAAVTIAEPLAFLPRENVMLQGPVPGELTLKKLIKTSLAPGGPGTTDELSGYIRKIGAGLAELHTCGVTAGKVVTWEDRLPEIEGRIARIAELEPEVATTMSSLLRRFETLAAEHPAGPPVPTHQSFRPAQVLLHEGKIGFIDFDGFCQAEPALDLALFRAILKDLGLRALLGGGGSVGREARRKRLAQLDHLCEVFLDGYEAIAPVPRTRVALWEALYLLSLVVNCWRKVKPQRVEHRTELLAHHLRTSGLA